MADSHPDTPLPADVERDPIHLAAANWLVRLHAAPVSIRDALEWQSWLSQSPSHARAFSRMVELSQGLRSMPTPATISARQLARDGYDASIPLKEWKKTRRRQRNWAALAVAAALAGIVLTVVF